MRNIDAPVHMRLCAGHGAVGVGHWLRCCACLLLCCCPELCCAVCCVLCLCAMLPCAGGCACAWADAILLPLAPLPCAPLPCALRSAVLWLCRAVHCSVFCCLWSCALSLVLFALFAVCCLYPPSCLCSSVCLFCCWWCCLCLSFRDGFRGPCLWSCSLSVCWLLCGCVLISFCFCVLVIVVLVWGFV